MEPLSHYSDHQFSRRRFLHSAGVAGFSWMTVLGQVLAQKAEKTRQPAQSLILLWMAGGPSQFETFDPHPGHKNAYGTGAIDTVVKGIQLAEGLPQVAEVMNEISLVRSMVSKEGDHERGTYYLKTGYRPDPTVVHPSIGAILCKELPVGKTEIPRHVSILPGAWPSRGGFLGAEFDAFKTYDPRGHLPDVVSRVPDDRDRKRLQDLEVVERAFARGRSPRVEATLHKGTMQNARTMMTSEQLKAFDVTHEPAKVQKAYGDTPFGRACLAARRLTEVGVRCVEVTLDGWDSHANNHSLHKANNAILDPAFAALIRDLKERTLLARTVVLCLGEFGRTPKLNPASGRDHWPNGFSLAIAGGGIRSGRVVGASDPDGLKDPIRPVNVADIHATILAALGLDPDTENISPAKRPIKLSKGRVIAELLDA